MIMLKDGRLYRDEYCFNHRIYKDGVPQYRQDELNHFFRYSEEVEVDKEKTLKNYMECPSCNLRIEIK